MSAQKIKSFGDLNPLSLPVFFKMLFLLAAVTQAVEWLFSSEEKENKDL